MRLRDVPHVLLLSLLLFPRCYMFMSAPSTPEQRRSRNLRDFELDESTGSAMCRLCDRFYDEGHKLPRRHRGRLGWYRDGTWGAIVPAEEPWIELDESTRRVPAAAAQPGQCGSGGRQ